MNKVDKLKRYAANTFIAGILTLFMIDAMPGIHRFHAILQEKIDPLLKATGLWQGYWDLFAPVPDKENIRLSAEVIYPDGTVFHWRSPDWKDKSAWYRFRYFRRQEYYDNVRRDKNRPAWPALARHILQLAKEEHGDQQPAQISIHRHWWNVPPIQKKFVQLAYINEPMESYRFYHQVFADPSSAR